MTRDQPGRKSGTKDLPVRIQYYQRKVGVEWLWTVLVPPRVEIYMKLMSCAWIIPGPWVGLNSRPTGRLVVSSIPADCLREMRFPCAEDFHLASLSIQNLLCSRGMTGSWAKMASDNLFHGSSMACLVPQLIRRGLQAVPAFPPQRSLRGLFPAASAVGVTTFKPIYTREKGTGGLVNGANSAGIEKLLH